MDCRRHRSRSHDYDKGRTPMARKQRLKITPASPGFIRDRTRDFLLRERSVRRPPRYALATSTLVLPDLMRSGHPHLAALAQRLAARESSEECPEIRLSRLGRARLVQVEHVRLRPVARLHTLALILRHHALRPCPPPLFFQRSTCRHHLSPRLSPESHSGRGV